VTNKQIFEIGISDIQDENYSQKQFGIEANLVAP